MNDIAGTGCDILVPFSERLPLRDIEHSITKTYKKTLWSKFVRAINDFEMIKEGDKVAVAVSGGKDSIVMAKLFQELKKHWKVKFDLEFISMDPGYHESIRKLLIDNCNYLNIPIKIYNSDIFKVTNTIAKDYPCYMCARMRRGFLYSKAKELGCNKLALGHHFNDVIETTLLNMLYSGSFKTMLPKLKSQNFENIELIRPLYYIEESHIKNFIQKSGIWPLNCACMVSAKKIGNKRYEIKDLIEKMKKNFNGVDKSIFHAAQNVNMDSILGWTKDGEKHSFMEDYDI
ncbi:tRNA 2-thiocytidine biosynthesis protein TtcA [Clostridium sp. cel8]|uniref:tRNA 2-thiocytidine biosynthesis TtcA family protein n=1 Tax=Clostridium sp. cel8 TaxID=2663123 RepID=UPI0015F6EE44|nr:ATP-binding protein [Clostridium sp. cel8]MBA5851303.1 tRNA 2-thiocytidine biosynthesis protein TtcA [Clostridium sp. cel8]